MKINGSFTTLLTTVLFMVTAPVSAQKITGEVLAEFETAFEKGMHTFNVPGSAVALVENGEIVYAKAFGVRNVETGAPFTTRTAYRVASNTKSMTSMMIATLVDEGVLDWDTLAIEIYPEFKLPTDELTHSTSVRELLGMGTGIGSNILTPHWDEYSAIELLSALATEPVLSEKGQFFYNNEVYASAAYVATIAAGNASANLLDAYKSLMQARVFNPIGMDSTVIADDPASVSNNYATSYSFSVAGGPRALEEVPVGAIGPAAPVGGVITNVTDMARYLITQLNEGVTPDGVRVVSAEALTETWHPQTMVTGIDPWLTPPAGYGMGWIEEHYGDVRILRHGGGIDGFASEMALLPETKIGIVILSNSSLGETLGQFMRYKLTELLYGMAPQGSKQVAIRYQGQVEELTAMTAMFASAHVDAKAITPYLGNYEHGWRVERRDDETLWMARNGWEFQLLPTPDGYIVSSGVALGAQVAFTGDANGKLKFGISFDGSSTDFAKLM